MITEAGMLTVMRNFACNRFGHVPDNIVRNVDEWLTRRIR